MPGKFHNNTISLQPSLAAWRSRGKAPYRLVTRGPGDGLSPSPRHANRIDCLSCEFVLLQRVPSIFPSETIKSTNLSVSRTKLKHCLKWTPNRKTTHRIGTCKSSNFSLFRSIKSNYWNYIFPYLRTTLFLYKTAFINFLIILNFVNDYRLNNFVTINLMIPCKLTPSNEQHITNIQHLHCSILTPFSMSN